MPPRALKPCVEGIEEVSRSLFVFGWQDETDLQMYKANSLNRLKGRWIQLPDLVQTNKWNQLLDQLLPLPCTVGQFFNHSKFENGKYWSIFQNILFPSTEPLLVDQILVARTRQSVQICFCKIISSRFKEPRRPRLESFLQMLICLHLCPRNKGIMVKMSLGDPESSWKYSYMHGLNQVWVSYLAVVDRSCPSH